MSNALDLTGQKIGMLTVKGRAPDVIVGKDKRHLRAWYCDCDCGTKDFVTTTEKLRKEKYKSCGCLSKSNRFQTHPNKYELCEDYVIFYTHNNEKFYIDVKDVDLVKQYTWCINKGYVVNRDGILLHRLITNPPSNMDVDHINHNKLDNRRCNLRIVFDYENMWNQKISKNNTSGVTGVYFEKNTGKWIAKIYVNGKQIFLGRFNAFEEAVRVRKEAEEKYFGEYSYDNSMKVGEAYGDLSYIS